MMFRIVALLAAVLATSNAFIPSRNLVVPAAPVMHHLKVEKPMDFKSSRSARFMSDAAMDASGSEKKSMLQKIKSVIPPANERKKLIPLALMFFCILFNYTILRDTKVSTFINENIMTTFYQS